MPRSPDSPSRDELIAAALRELRRDLDGPAAHDPLRDAELRRRLQDFADLFLDPADPADADVARPDTVGTCMDEARPRRE